MEEVECRREGRGQECHKEDQQSQQSWAQGSAETDASIKDHAQRGPRPLAVDSLVRGAEAV